MTNKFPLSILERFKMDQISGYSLLARNILRNNCPKLAQMAFLNAQNLTKNDHM